MPPSTIFQLYRGGQFYWLRKPEYPEKTINLSQVTDKLISYFVSSTPRLNGIRTHVSLHHNKTYINLFYSQQINPYFVCFHREATSYNVKS